MSKKIWIGAALVGGTLLAAGLVIGDEERGEMAERGRAAWGRMTLDVAPVENTLYREECGSCHFPYQPGLLPTASWQAVMNTLDDHFGDNAALPVEKAEAIAAYLLANAADRSDYKRSGKIAASVEPGTAPRRITETRYFRAKHHELPADIAKNPQIGSLSNCIACHTKADGGSYNEHEVRIPGRGRWEDD